MGSAAGRAGQDVGALVAALADAKAALERAEVTATEELIAAKAAYQDSPTLVNRQRKATAVAAIQALRAAVRADRPGTRVGVDAYVGDEPEGAVQR